MKRICFMIKKAYVFSFAVSLLALVACEGSETRSKVDDSVEKFTGKKQVELMEKMKKDVEESMDKQAERLKETE